MFVWAAESEANTIKLYYISIDKIVVIICYVCMCVLRGRNVIEITSDFSEKAECILAQNTSVVGRNLLHNSFKNKPIWTLTSLIIRFFCFVFG